MAYSIDAITDGCYKGTTCLINICDLWIIHCNMEPESAKIAYETIIGE